MNHSKEKSQPDPTFILVVEDDVDIGEMLVNIIQSETSYHASWVPDGLQALEVAETIKPQLFILDYNLPQMNGVEVYHKLQAIEGFQQTPVLFLSANPHIDEVVQQGMTVLQKPFEMGELLQAIEKLLAS